MDDDTSPHPLDFQALATAQNQDNKFLQELQADPQHYAHVLMDHNATDLLYAAGECTMEDMYSRWFAGSYDHMVSPCAQSCWDHSFI